MKLFQILPFVVTAVTIAACSSLKKNTTSTAPVTSTEPVKVNNSSPLVFIKPADGVYLPGNEELAAIQAHYQNVTLEKLKEGHTIYTKGACINCHFAMNIFERGEEQWKNIIDDMAQRANITDQQKDAVYKYVLAIKAVQIKSGK